MDAIWTSMEAASRFHDTRRLNSAVGQSVLGCASVFFSSACTGWQSVHRLDCDYGSEMDNMVTGKSF